RPLIWKTRDRLSKPNNRIYYNTDYEYKFIAVVDSGATYAWMGVNEFGFSILNSASYDLIESRDFGNGGFMRHALGTVKSIDEFEELLISTNEEGRQTYANFAVLDSTGSANLFEVSANDYWQFDAATTNEGWIIRSNFSQNGGGESGLERYNRSIEIVTNLCSNNQLNHNSLFEHQFRDFSDANSNAIEFPFYQQFDENTPFGFYNTEYSINSNQTVSGAIIRGILPNESTYLTTLFAILGNPITAVTVPYFPVGEPPLVSYSDSIPALTFSANAIKKKLFWENEFIDSFLIENDESGLKTNIIEFEEEILCETEMHLEEWRNNNFEVEDILSFQSDIADSVLTFINTISINDSLIANFDFEQTSQIDSYTIQFYDKSLHAPTHWLWDFDEDGVIDSQIQNPIYIFPDEGMYTVMLYIYNENYSDFVIKEDFVIVANSNETQNIIPNKLLPAYPNPFNPSTTITIINNCNTQYKKIGLDIFNIKGQKIKQLNNNKLSEGKHSFVWKGKNNFGVSVSSGIYLVKLQIDDSVFTQKIVLLK
ncbi:MAG: T9SS type A sorting domain-containing protein, partial [Candidatus Cloacimonadota bacterium]|nr:T9SS type A sorting domain-containing protein [Candidatus Cloacimonadota bacterium]